jgi:rhamnose transport system ATP-binding protein
LADRVLVLREGHLTANMTRAEANEDSVMRAATLTVTEAAA